MRPPIDIATIDAQTGPMIAAGHRIFQTHKYAGSDAEHVATLLRRFDVPQGAIVLDAGCGIGEVSRLMAEQRPDLSFILMNLSQLQLAHCPVGPQFCAALDDCHACKLPDGFVDAAMYSSALCQMDIPVALAEARRVLKPGGVLLVNDMVRTQGTPEAMEQVLAARVLTVTDLIDHMEQAGFAIDSVALPDADATHFEGLLSEAGLSHLLDGIVPVIIRAVAAPLN